MSENPLLKLESYGQSIWMDFISRNSISSGQLQKLIGEDGVSGVTSNPTIFEKAIRGSHDYDDLIQSRIVQGQSPFEIYRALTVEDIQMAADLLRPVFERAGGQDGFVSIEVSPHLAYDTATTIDEARSLWQAVSRPNVMIKVPATEQGFPAIRELVGEGINVNITLLFGLPEYRQVVEAYLSGLESRITHGKPVDRQASVASFFLSRIDVLIDPQLEKWIQEDGLEAPTAQKLHGQVSIASAKAAYAIYTDIFNSPRFRRLAEKGAHPQRLLWASTSTKNPAYSDVKYVEALIGPHTINTVPLETLDAYRDHGHPAPHLSDDLDQALWVLESLTQVEIDLNQINQQLIREGVDKFSQSYDQLMEALQAKQQPAPTNRQQQAPLQYKK
jgi:transaldolase